MLFIVWMQDCLDKFMDFYLRAAINLQIVSEPLTVISAFGTELSAPQSVWLTHEAKGGGLR